MALTPMLETCLTSETTLTPPTSDNEITTADSYGMETIS